MAEIRDGWRFPADGAYQICRRIGGGGEGDVYLVRHIPTDQMRAAKLVRSEDPGRQMHELHMMKHLHHPALPRIIDVFQWEGQVWLIMEYIQGRALSEALGERVTGEQFFRIARELSEVLIYLHSREKPVLHLDIKPSNILVKRDGHTALIDFGASAISDGGGAAGGGFGTRGFAAPEQMPGAGAGLDGRADIYGFGASMYYFLHRKIPYAEEEFCLGRRYAVHGECTGGFGERLWRHQADIILKKCLRRDREQRYPDFQTVWQVICRAEKKYVRWQQMRGVAGAVVLLFAVMLFAAGALCLGTLHDVNGEMETDGEDRYRQLLEMASGMGLAQSYSFYEEAAQMEPDGDWSLVLLESLTEDYLFTVEEEELVKKLIYGEVRGTGRTVEEEMRYHEEIYGEFAYRLGLAYWYFYQESGGKRAAASWFVRAVDSQENAAAPSKWLESARIHADIGGYYEKLGRQNEKGERQAGFWTYWADLKKLWKLESLQGEAAIRRQVAQELLSCLIMGAYEVRQAGESREQIEEILGMLAEVIQDERLWPDSEQREVAEEQYRDAAAAVERVFAGEGGLEFEKEQESAE